jgi:hypothetical protein
MARLVLGCLGDSFEGITLCSGESNIILNDITDELLQFIRIKIPKKKIIGDLEVSRFLMELNVKTREISIGLLQGFIAYHRTHEENGNKIYLELQE